MEKYVFVLQEDVCQKNGKDPSATLLLEKMAKYGKVFRFDDCVNEVKNEYQTVIDNLSAQVEALSERNLAPDELRLVNAYRLCKADSDAQYKAQIANLEAGNAKIKKSFDTFAEQIKTIVNSKVENDEGVAVVVPSATV